MSAIGEYVPDVTEGITRVEDLPKTRVKKQSRSYKRRKCPYCGHSAYRDKVATRTLHDLGDLKAVLLQLKIDNWPVDISAMLNIVTHD